MSPKESNARLSSEAKKSQKSMAALRKKIQGQIDALRIAKTLIEQIMQSGLHTVQQEKVQPYLKNIELLKAAHLIGLREHFLMLLQAIQDKKFWQATERIIKINTIIQNAEEHLSLKLNDPELRPDTKTELEKNIGYIWKREELIQYGNVRYDVELIEFIFYRHENPVLNETMEEGFCLDTQRGKIYRTQILRPKKAKSSIPESDSTLEPFVVKELAIYPGSMNPRVRWEEAHSRPFRSEHYAAFTHHARSDYAQVIKEVKSEIKNPMGEKNPVFLLKVANIVQQEEYFAIQSAQREIIRLGNIQYFPKLFSKNKQEIHDSIWGIQHFPPKLLQNHTMAVMFEANIETNCLIAKPLAIIADERMVRLVY